MTPPSNIVPSIAKNTFLTIALALSVTSAVLAIDGVLSNGGRSSSTRSFSTLKKDLRMSLQTGYQFRDNRSQGYLRSNGKVVQMNSVLSIQKGNVTLNLPIRTKPFVSRFQTPSAPPIR